MMDLSILVARIRALTYIAAGIAALSGKITFAQIADDFERSPGLTFTSGFFTLVFGVLLVSYHNIWVRDWTVLITIVAWMSLIKGVLLIAFPHYISAFKGWYKDNKIWGVIMLALGLLFAYFGWLAH